jgi:NADPH:quinone reductase
VGLACVELARLRDTRVIAAVGSETKANVVRDHGADAVIDYSSEDLRERVKAITGGEGGDVCVDNVGGKLFATLARLMRWNGRLLPVGFTSGEVPSIPMNLPASEKLFDRRNVQRRLDESLSGRGRMRHAGYHAIGQ